MERFHTMFFVAGVGCFAIAFVLSMVFPWMTLGTYHGMEFKTMEELSSVQTREFQELVTTHEAAFQEAWGEPTSEVYAEVLRRGRDLYIGQACWHCHSQYIREVSNEAQRFGPPTVAQDYQNELNQPHLWGTRRVGPDLSREGGLRSNDWHIAHMINPKDVVPTSVMPSYAFWFEEDGTPQRDGFAILSYLQWLGTTFGGAQ
jgi:cytochrome c oxidase cbb3-type subunit 2